MYEFNNGFQPKNCKSGHDFEIWVQGLLNSLGFDARLTGGNDNGVDIIATIDIKKKIYRFYIQCKFYNRPVGRAPICEVVAGTQYYGNNGYPVVITNNKMTQGTRAYANQLGVEVITELQLNELDLLVKKQMTINNSHTGLMGIIVGCIQKNSNLVLNAIKTYEKKDTPVEEITDKEQLCQELISVFDEANLLMQESAELQLKANACQQQAMALQKEALLKSLKCP